MLIDQPLEDQLNDISRFFHSGIPLAVAICCALALSNALELLLLILTTFRRFRGLYFWSLVVSCSGVAVYTTGLVVAYVQPAVQLAGVIVTTCSWPAMITGQSLVLYSRLGVLFGEGYNRLLRAIKWMIVVNGVVFWIIMTGQ